VNNLRILAIAVVGHPLILQPRDAPGCRLRPQRGLPAHAEGDAARVSVILSRPIWGRLQTGS
jgi:hypothetical protein